MYTTHVLDLTISIHRMGGALAAGRKSLHKMVE